MPEWIHLTKGLILPKIAFAFFLDFSVDTVLVRFHSTTFPFHGKEVFCPGQFFDGSHLINATAKSTVRRNRVDVYLCKVAFLTDLTGQVWQVCKNEPEEDFIPRVFKNMWLEERLESFFVATFLRLDCKLYNK